MARLHVDPGDDALDERLSLAGVEAVEVVAEAREVARHGLGRGVLKRGFFKVAPELGPFFRERFLLAFQPLDLLVDLPGCRLAGQRLGQPVDESVLLGDQIADPAVEHPGPAHQVPPGDFSPFHLSGKERLDEIGGAGDLVDPVDHGVFDAAGRDVGLIAGAILHAPGTDVVAIVPPDRIAGALDEHRASAEATAGKADQQVLRRHAPGRSLAARPELLLDRLKEIFLHERFMDPRAMPDAHFPCRPIRGSLAYSDLVVVYFEQRLKRSTREHGLN